jgi:hypothetical protein
MRGLGVRRQAERQRVHRRDGPRAHGEDVAQDAAHAGRRALMRLDVGRVVVASILKITACPSPISTTPGILAGAADHLRAGGRQLRSHFFDDL